MARRIAAAILLTVWAILVAGGVAAYWVTRGVLVGDLDATLTQRATAVARAVSRGPRAGRPRFVVSSRKRERGGGVLDFAISLEQ